MPIIEYMDIFQVIGVNKLEKWLLHSAWIEISLHFFLKTLIDHISTNDLRNTSVIKSHIIITDITEHLPCVTTVTHPDILIKGYRTIINDDNRQTFNLE